MIATAGDPRIRRSGIGGSDIAKIAGVSKFGGAMDVWLEKIGQSAPLIETERMYWGTRLEDVVAREYAKRSGNKVRQAPTITDPVTGLRARVIRYSADMPWRMAHVDRLTSSADGRRRGFEAKTAGNFAAADFGEEGSDQVPPDYLVQCMWYMGVTGYETWDLAVLIGGQQFRRYTIERDPDLIESLWAVGDEFWLENVRHMVPPPIDGSESARKYLEGTHIYAEEVLPMSDRLYELALEYESVNRGIKDLEARKDALGNGIRDQMQGHGKAGRDNARITWSRSTVRRLDTTALVKDNPSIVAPYYVESEQHRLTVTVRESK